MSGTGGHPAQIGRYHIDRVLGTGAMGVVYLAHDPAIDRQVALKLIRADLLDDQGRREFVDRFAVEARAIGRFHHPNIVSIYDLSLHDGNPFLVMEYIEGESLYQTIRRNGRFGPPAAVQIMHQVLGALGAAHAGGIVHRDVKPANVMIAPGQQVKMMDFGIARFDNSVLTQPGSVVGTPRYMSPEQILGQEVDSRGDLFSAGVVLYEMLLGAPPFDGGSMIETMQKILHFDPPDLALHDQAIPPALASVVRKALAKDPTQRFQDAQAMAEALRGGVAAVANDDRTRLARQPEAGVSDDDARRAERALATIVGPIAKIMVKRALPNARSSEELWQALAGNIPSDDERQKFLRQRARGG